MQNRRNFLKQASLMLAGGLVAPQLLSSCGGKSGQAAATASESSKYIGLQLYSLRDLVKEEGIQKVLETAAKMGYKNLETASYDNGKIYGLAPAEFKKMVNDLGMKCTSAHLGQAFTKEKEAEVMSWWRLASAVSNAGGLGLIGAGSMHPEILREHIRKCRVATEFPFGVNIPLMYPQIEEIMNIVVEEGVKIIFTSAGNPKTWTGWLKERGITVVHIVSSSRFAVKCEEAGVDAVVAEGFEAGGHNGREETTTFCLIPAVREATTLPLIAAGGIATGEGILAAMVLGAEGVQIGTRFALTDESSASPLFKEYCLSLGEGDTKLLLKKLAPTRLVKNSFREAVEKAEDSGASMEELRTLLGRGRAKKGIFEGDLEEGELEIGQVSSIISRQQPVAEVMKELVEACQRAAKKDYL